mmetsp:Transcript_1899/g.7075  ORF Transcript_1899/g.7075 Transcript_1899/m.7075 type:complete len:211 (+) Transcript_1899:2181-2813(+)
MDTFSLSSAVKSSLWSMLLPAKSCIVGIAVGSWFSLDSFTCSGSTLACRAWFSCMSGEASQTADWSDTLLMWVEASWAEMSDNTPWERLSSGYLDVFSSFLRLVRGWVVCLTLLLLLDTTVEVLRKDGTFWAPLEWRPTGVAFFPAVVLTNLEGMGGFLLDVRLFFLDVWPDSSREPPPLAVEPASEPRRDERTLDALLLLFSMLSVLPS